MKEPETQGRIQSKGKPLTLVGHQVKVGDKIPDATLVDLDMNEVRLSDFFGKPLIISLVPSLDTSVCNAQTKCFDREAASLGDEVTVLTISNDLPYAQKRFIEKEGISNVTILSDYRYRQFGPAVGLLIKETGLLARAVIVVSPEGLARYVQIVADQGQQPDYQPVLEAVRDLLVTV